MKPIISVRNLSKKYIIGENIHSRGARTFRDIFDYKTKRLFRRDVKRSKEDTTIWALKDVSFDVDQSEVVGIIGRNGAGKSTLLKILSRITEPTEGNVTLRGRVASLLEVGTGFNQELTGRENIFLNGSILGMKKIEIKNNFDEIVSFAEIEKFIDTPVKRYSSGMYVRLAFAVAAHLEPEILLVDEVLAVGDAEFQKKCLGKMGSVAREGRTVLFVSHNLVTIQALCPRVVWLDSGRVRVDGTAQRVVEAYVSDSATNAVHQSVDLLSRVCGGKDVQLVGVDLLSGDSHSCNTFEYGKELNIRFTIRVMNRNRRFFAVEWFICTATGQRALYGSSSPQQAILISPTEEHVCVECKIPFLPLTAGFYRLDCLLSVPHQERLDEVEGVSSFEVVRCDPWNSGFNLKNTTALTTTANHWRILSGGKELLASS